MNGQKCRADRPRGSAHGGFDDCGVFDAGEVQVREPVARAFGHAVADRFGHGAFDQDRLDFDDRGNRGGGDGEVAGGFVDPGCDEGFEFGPVVRGLAQAVRVDALGGHGAFQRVKRCDVQKLGRAAFAIGNGQGAEGGGVQVGARDDLAVQHQAAADEGPDVDIGEVLKVVAAPGEVFGYAGGGCVVLDDDIEAGFGADGLGQVETLPALHRFPRRADKFQPIPDLVRAGDAQARDAGARLGMCRVDLAKRLSQEAEDLFDVGIVVGGAARIKDGALEIDKHKFRRTASDGQPQRHDAVGIEAHGNRGFADLALDRFAPGQKIFGFESADDVRHGLRRKPGFAGDGGAGHRALPANK